MQQTTEKTQVTFEVLVCSVTGTIVRTDDWSLAHQRSLGARPELRTLVVEGGFADAHAAAIDAGGNAFRKMKFKSL